MTKSVKETGRLLIRHQFNPLILKVGKYDSRPQWMYCHFCNHSIRDETIRFFTVSKEIDNVLQDDSHFMTCKEIYRICEKCMENHKSEYVIDEKCLEKRDWNQFGDD